MTFNILSLTESNTNSFTERLKNSDIIENLQKKLSEKSLEYDNLKKIHEKYLDDMKIKVKFLDIINEKKQKNQNKSTKLSLRYEENDKKFDSSKNNNNKNKCVKLKKRLKKIKLMKIESFSFSILRKFKFKLNLSNLTSNNEVFESDRYNNSTSKKHKRIVSNNNLDLSKIYNFELIKESNLNPIQNTEKKQKKSNFHL